MEEKTKSRVNGKSGFEAGFRTQHDVLPGLRERVHTCWTWTLTGHKSISFSSSSIYVCSAIMYPDLESSHLIACKTKALALCLHEQLSQC